MKHKVFIRAEEVVVYEREFEMSEQELSDMKRDIRRMGWDEYCVEMLSGGDDVVDSRPVDDGSDVRVDGKTLYEEDL